MRKTVVKYITSIMLLSAIGAVSIVAQNLSSHAFAQSDPYTEEFKESAREEIREYNSEQQEAREREKNAEAAEDERERQIKECNNVLVVPCG